jgi:hypothetical protein
MAKRPTQKTITSGFSSAYLLKNRALYPVFTSTTNKDTDLRPMIDGCSCYSNGLLECTGLCGNNSNGYNNSILII